MYFFNFSILHKLHEIRYFSNFRDRMPCYDFKSLHQHPVLVICDGHCFICRPWPPERTVIQSFVHEKETIAFPQETFDLRGRSSAENKSVEKQQVPEMEKCCIPDSVPDCSWYSGDLRIRCRLDETRDRTAVGCSYRAVDNSVYSAGHR